MDETVYIQLTFENDSGKRTSLNVPYPLESLTSSDVSNAMDLIITNNIFYPALVSKHSAVIITRTREQIYS